MACRASECDAHAPTPRRNPKSYRRPLLFVSYTRMLGLIKLTQNRSGAMMPCHNPAQKPAGVAPGNLYGEFGPAILSMLAIRPRILYGIPIIKRVVVGSDCPDGQALGT